MLGDVFNTLGDFSDDTTFGADKLAGLSTPAPDSELAKFRTPSLRQVALTGPYFHAGQFATLEQVVAFYNAGGGNSGVGETDSALVPLELSAEEQADLVAFLETLTGQPVASELSEDTSAP